MGTRDTIPVILTTGTTPASITLTAGVPGAPSSLPPLDLTNRLRVPIEVSELHFLLDETVDADLAMFGLEVNLTAGRRLFTQGFCPVVALGLNREAIAGYEGNQVPLVVSLHARTVRWILPRPFILAPNEAIGGLVRLAPGLAYTGDGTIRLGLTVRGRRMAPGSKAPAWRAVPFAAGTVFTVADRPPADFTFRNPFASVLNVSSINAYTVGSSALLPGSLQTITVSGPGGLTNEVQRGIATAAPAAFVFGQRNGLEVAHKLNPWENYNVTLGNPTESGGVLGTAVALVGWREE